MKRSMWIRFVTITAVGLWAIASSTSAAFAGDITLMRGMWSGFGQSAISPRVIDPCWDIITTTRTGFQGTLELDPYTIPVNCRILPNGDSEGSGIDAEGNVVFIFGGAVAMADGSVRVASLAYLEITADGSVDIGAMALVQLSGGPNWNSIGGANITNRWMGSYRSRRGFGGDITMDLSNQGPDAIRGQPSTQIVGSATIADLFGNGDAGNFNLIGTIGPPSTDLPVTIAALGILNT